MGYERNPRVIGLEFVHTAERCAGDTTPCCIHRPSDHPLNTARLLWRADLSLMERVCEHGVGHPDPDDLRYKRMVSDPDYFEKFAFEVHSCDGCCQGGN